MWAPIAVLLIEPDRMRRRLMGFCLATGLAVAAYFLWRILARSSAAMLQEGHIVYVTEFKPPLVVGLGYLAATGFVLALSSHRTLIILAAVVLFGSAVAYAFYWQAFVSVWCFFAAAAGAIILLHFEQTQRRRARLAAATRITPL